MNEKALDSSNSAYLTDGNLNGWEVPRWSEQETVDYLTTGRNDNAGVGGEMTPVIEHGTAWMTKAGLKAISAYLKFIGDNRAAPAVEKPLAPAERTLHDKAK